MLTIFYTMSPSDVHKNKLSEIASEALKRKMLHLSTGSFNPVIIYNHNHLDIKFAQVKRECYRLDLQRKTVYVMGLGKIPLNLDSRVERQLGSLYLRMHGEKWMAEFECKGD